MTVVHILLHLLHLLPIWPSRLLRHSRTRTCRWIEGQNRCRLIICFDIWYETISETCFTTNHKFSVLMGCVHDEKWLGIFGSWLLASATKWASIPDGMLTVLIVWFWVSIYPVALNFERYNQIKLEIIELISHN